MPNSAADSDGRGMREQDMRGFATSCAGTANGADAVAPPKV